MKEKRIIQRGTLVSLQDSELAAAVSFQNAQNQLLAPHFQNFSPLQPVLSSAATQLTNNLLAGAGIKFWVF